MQSILISVSTRQAPSTDTGAAQTLCQSIPYKNPRRESTIPSILPPNAMEIYYSSSVLWNPATSFNKIASPNPRRRKSSLPESGPRTARLGQTRPRLIRTTDALNDDDRPHFVRSSFVDTACSPPRHPIHLSPPSPPWTRAGWRVSPGFASDDTLT